MNSAKVRKRNMENKLKKTKHKEDKAQIRNDIRELLIYNSEEFKRNGSIQKQVQDAVNYVLDNDDYFNEDVLDAAEEIVKKYTNMFEPESDTETEYENEPHESDTETEYENEPHESDIETADEKDEKDENKDENEDESEGNSQKVTKKVQKKRTQPKSELDEEKFNEKIDGLINYSTQLYGDKATLAVSKLSGITGFEKFDNRVLSMFTYSQIKKLVYTKQKERMYNTLERGLSKSLDKMTADKKGLRFVTGRFMMMRFTGNQFDEVYAGFKAKEYGEKTDKSTNFTPYMKSIDEYIPDASDDKVFLTRLKFYLEFKKNPLPSDSENKLLYGIKLKRDVEDFFAKKMYSLYTQKGQSWEKVETFLKWKLGLGKRGGAAGKTMSVEAKKVVEFVNSQKYNTTEFADVVKNVHAPQKQYKVFDTLVDNIQADFKNIQKKNTDMLGEWNDELNMLLLLFLIRTNTTTVGQWNENKKRLISVLASLSQDVDMFKKRSMIRTKGLCLTDGINYDCGYDLKGNKMGDKKKTGNTSKKKKAASKNKKATSKKATSKKATSKKAASKKAASKKKGKTSQIEIIPSGSQEEEG